MGGEKRRGTSEQDGRLGSPPRGRGKAWVDGEINSKERITPAWAGKSTAQMLHVRQMGDHPRVGGEKIVVSM